MYRLSRPNYNKWLSKYRPIGPERKSTNGVGLSSNEVSTNGEVQMESIQME